MNYSKLNRLFLPLSLALLLAFAAQLVLSLRDEAQTWDEAIHLSAGYTYLRTGDFRMNLEHPPLTKYLQAAMLLPWNPKAPVETPYWKDRDQVMFGADFLYNNRVDAGTLLFAGRFATILAVLGLGVWLALWTRRRFGPAVALVALALLVFDPNLIAHGRYVTSDAWATVFIFCAATAWLSWLDSGRWLTLAGAGVFLGLALSTKFSCVFLPPVIGLLTLLHWIFVRRRSLVRYAGGLAVEYLLAVLVIVAVYWPVGDSAKVDLQAMADSETAFGRVLLAANARYGIPLHPYLIGLWEVAQHNAYGHESYLMGYVSKQGWWDYFPIVFAVKTPAAVLALLSAALVAALIRFRRTGWTAWAMLLPPVVYFGASMMSSINIGVRHILPVYPFLYVFSAAALIPLMKTPRRWALPVAALALAAVESLAIFPYYTSFFNIAAGGPANGPRYLLDSNIDWGQDLKRFGQYIRDHNLPRPCLLYFGTASFDYYKVSAFNFPTTEDLVKTGGKAECEIVGASVTPLYGLYVPLKDTAWLRRRKPFARVGYSIYLFDLRTGGGRDSLLGFAGSDSTKRSARANHRSSPALVRNPAGST